VLDCKVDGFLNASCRVALAFKIDTHETLLKVSGGFDWVLPALISRSLALQAQRGRNAIDVTCKWHRSKIQECSVLNETVLLEWISNFCTANYKFEFAYYLATGMRYLQAVEHCISNSCIILWGICDALFNISAGEVPVDMPLMISGTIHDQPCCCGWKAIVDFGIMDCYASKNVAYYA